MDQNIRTLTTKERMVLEFIEEYMMQKKQAPSYQEIKDYFGFASYNSVQRYLKQLQNKDYIFIPGGNQKRAITLVKPSHSVESSLNELNLSAANTMSKKGTSLTRPESEESLSLPLLGHVAAGQPLEAFEDDEFIDVPPALVRNPNKSYALKVVGQSMIDDGIFDGDFILVQEQKDAANGEIVVAVVDNEATVKHFYWHPATKQVELRPANSDMDSFWHRPQEIDLRGVVVGLIRKY